MNNIITLILGMTFVTYLSRVLPFLILSEGRLSNKTRRFFQFIPYTALGSLIIPNVFSATPQLPIASILGILFVFIYGWYKGGIITSVLGSIFVTFIVLLGSVLSFY